jgi:hypothetical protein
MLKMENIKKRRAFRGSFSGFKAVKVKWTLVRENRNEMTNIVSFGAGIRMC